MSDWQIEQPCPQCGAPVILEESDHILSCTFCRTRHILSTPDHFRYCMPPPDSVDGDLIYVPYWRHRGLSFSIQAAEISSRFVDVNTVASSLKGLPPSLGVRPQVLKLKFYSSTITGSFLSYTAENREPATAEKPHEGEGMMHHVGEVVSLVYAPFFVKGEMLHDAFEKKPIAAFDLSNPDIKTAITGKEDWRIEFIPTLCPQCGWDLLGEKDSLVLLCRNCQSAWTSRNQALDPVNFTIMSYGEMDSASSMYLPFWQLKIHAEGAQLDSYADLIRLANLPRVPNAALEGKPMLFWSPAFKVNPSLFIRWCRQMTVFQPEGAETNKLPNETIYPVTLPLKEAVDGIIITLASIMVDKKKTLSLLPNIRATLQDAKLVYHPFTVVRNELIHPVMKVSLESSALKYGVEL
jgi:hypothetical protein